MNTDRHTFWRACLLPALLTLLSFNVGAQTWQNAGSADFSAGQAKYISLAFNGTTPYVAYEDLANSNKATVMMYNGTSWVAVGSAGFSAGGAYSISLAFNGTTPYVAYSDGANSFNATVMKYNGTSWVTVGSAGFSAGAVNNTSLAFDGTTPYVAYQDGGTSSANATVMKYNGTSWVTVGSAGFSAGQADYTSLAFNGTTPYVAYADNGNSGKATVMMYNGTSWVTVGSAGFSAGAAFYTSLAFDGTTPYVAYEDNGNSGKATVMMYNGTSWVTVGGAGLSAGGVNYTSLAFNGTTPYVAYQDVANSNKATVKMYNGSSWVTAGNAGFSAGQASYTSLAFNGTTPYVAYQDVANSNKATVMSLLPCTAPTTPTVTATASTVCSGSGTTLNISGTLNGAANWAIYTAGCGTGTPVTNTSGTYSTGALSATTTYYVRGEGGCLGTPGSCNTGTTVTVNPTPDVTQPSNQSVCVGSPTTAVAFTGSVSGTNFSWTNNNPSIGLAASGTDNIPSFTATNSTSAPITGTITVTPSTGNATQTFSYTGAVQTWTVPAGVTSVTVDVTGAAGMTSSANDAVGGKGGRVQATVPVTPGEILQFTVGQGGVATTSGGYGGGGAAGITSCGTANGGGGGGATDIRRAPYGLGDRIVVAGGGGGAGGKRVQGCGPGSGGGGGGGYFGGGGGGSYGGNGGTGGTPTAGGTGGSSSFSFSGTSGTSGLGGAGGAAPTNSQSSNYPGTIGGDGGNTTGASGLSGGASIGQYAGGSGGGGNSFTTAGITNVTHTQGVQTGNGQLTISYSVPPTCTGTPKTFDITVNPKYAITSSAGSNGSISPNVTTSVCSGTNASYTITAASGYHIQDVLADAVSVGAVGTYTFTNVTATHTISATFAPNCVNPDQPTVTASPNIVCSGSGTTLTITGNLNGAGNWAVYSGGCGGTFVGNVPTTGTTYTLSNLTSTATYSVRGEGGCLTTPGSCGSTTVTVNPTPVVSVSATAPACPGGSNGSITFGTPSVGTPTFSYSINGGTTYVSGNTFSNLSAGSGYSAVVKDANTCTSTPQPVTVPAGVDNTPPVAAAQNVTVNLDATGNASITAAQVNNGSNDNCGINSSLTSVTPTTFNCSNVPGVSSAGNAMAFTGGYVDVPNDASLNPQNTWTLETWVKTDPAYSGNQHGLIEKYDGGNMYGYLLRITTGNKLMAGLVTNGSGSLGAYVTGSTTLTPGTWYHVAATYSISGQVKLYVNGVADGSVNSSTASTMYSNPSTVSLKIGARGNDALMQLHGWMDEVRVWNVEHSQVQIKATMNKSLSGTEAGLVAYYRFEEAGASTTATDNTPLTTANTGTLTGSVARVASGAGVGGTTPVTLSVTDVNGNTSTTTAFVTVVDNTPPTVITKSATIYLDANGHATLTPAQVDNGSSDNCSFNMTVSPSSFTCGSIGSFAGTLNGNLTADNSFDAYLSTSDNTLGTAIGSGTDFRVTYALTAATLTPGTNYFLHIKGTDLGGPQSLLGDFTVTGNFEFANGLQSLSTNTSNWHVNTSGFGNSYNTPVSYGVNNVSPWGNRSGISANALNIWDPSGDNSSPATEYAYFSTPIIYNPDKTTVTLTAVDAGNNMTSAAATVSIVDNILPTVTAPANVVVPGWCTNVPAAQVPPLGTATASDNCSVASITNNAPASYPVGATTVRWTATDGSGNTNYADQTVTVVAGVITATSAVTPLYPMSGQEIQTIYLGYPSSAQSETMTVTPSGGTGTSFSYAWTKSNNCPGTTPTAVPLSGTNSSTTSYTWTPTSSDSCLGNTYNDNVYTFTVTATDNHGCSATTTKKLNVVFPYVSGNVELCHRVAVRGGTVTQQMAVAPSQVATHLGHGDYLGNCQVFNGTKSTVPVFEEEQSVAVYPNPTTGVFILELSSINQEAQIMITDVAGKLITTRTIAKDATPTATFDLSSLARGMYLIQVRDGELNYRTKIVVQ